MSEETNVVRSIHLDAANLTLNQWLALVYRRPQNILFLNVSFPSDEHRNEYLARIMDRSDFEIWFLLYCFLVKSGSIPLDEIRWQAYVAIKESDPGLYQKMAQHQYYKRLEVYKQGDPQVFPWEGNTWVLDLLPHFPQKAIDAIMAYLIAHIQVLPDHRINGLFDAIEIIRARYIRQTGTLQEKVNLLRSLEPRQFEYLTERLYAAMGYETELTPAQKDGGRDILVRKTETGLREEIRVECKQYHRPVGVEIGRLLLWVVGNEKATKGVVVTSSRFTSGILDLAKQDSRLELINGEKFIVLMNTYLGSQWLGKIERMIVESMQKFENISRKVL